MRERRLARWLAGLALPLLPAGAQAHAGAADAGLLNGLLHPVFGADHLLAMVSVGVVSARLGGASLWRVPLAFVAAMIAGGALGLWRLPLPHAELGIALSVLVLGGGIVLADHRTASSPILAFVLFFGVFHGHAHGSEIPRAASPALYTLGFVTGTSVLHILGLLVGELAGARRWLRVAGGLVAAAGLVFLLQTAGVAG